MSKKVTRYRRLQDACERLRDVAASHVAETRRLLDAAQRHEESRTHSLANIVERTGPAMSEVNDVRELELLGGVVDAAQDLVREASHDVASASNGVEHAVARLRSQERKLRASRRVLDRAIEVDRKDEDKAAQQMTDDFAMKLRRTA